MKNPQKVTKAAIVTLIPIVNGHHRFLWPLVWLVRLWILTC